MAPSESLATSITLLERLQRVPEDQVAWNAFVVRYGGMIEQWCRGWGLQEADAQDVTQNVMLELSRQMQLSNYRREGRFRSWLKTIAYRAWCDYIKRYTRPGKGSGGTEILHLLNSVEAREDFLMRLENECNRELLEVAMRRVQQRVNENTWEAFRLMTFEHLSGIDAAEHEGRLGVRRQIASRQNAVGGSSPSGRRSRESGGVSQRKLTNRRGIYETRERPSCETVPRKADCGNCSTTPCLPRIGENWRII